MSFPSPGRRYLKRVPSRQALQGTCARTPTTPARPGDLNLAKIRGGTPSTAGFLASTRSKQPAIVGSRDNFLTRYRGTAMFYSRGLALPVHLAEFTSNTFCPTPPAILEPSRLHARHFIHRLLRATSLRSCQLYR